MKIARSLFASVLFIGSLGAISAAMAEDGIIEKVPLTANSYCHEKFDAIQGRTLGTKNPTLKSDDVVDFYGPCSEKPTGKDQQHEQELDRQHRFQNEYED